MMTPASWGRGRASWDGFVDSVPDAARFQQSSRVDTGTT
jgi:hypothetical protein